MTVAELRERLAAYPDDGEVFLAVSRVAITEWAPLRSLAGGDGSSLWLEGACEP